MTSYRDLISIKDTYARVWNFLNLAARGALPRCQFVTPDGTKYRLSECVFTRNNGVAVMSANSGAYALELLPGGTYTLAESEIFFNSVLQVSVDEDGTMHILKDTIFKELGLKMEPITAVIGHINNRNLTNSVMLYHYPNGPKREALTLHGTELTYSAATAEISFSFAGVLQQYQVDKFDGFGLFNDKGVLIRQYDRFLALAPSTPTTMYFDSINPATASEQDIASGIMGELTLAMHVAKEDIELGFDILETMSEDIEDLYFLYNNGLLICDRHTGEQMLVPLGDDVIIARRIGDDKHSIRITNWNDRMQLNCNNL